MLTLTYHFNRPHVMPELAQNILNLQDNSKGALHTGAHKDVSCFRSLDTPMFNHDKNYGTEGVVY